VKPFSPREKGWVEGLEPGEAIQRSSVTSQQPNPARKPPQPRPTLRTPYHERPHARRVFLHATLAGMACVSLISRTLASSTIQQTIAQPALPWLREIAAATRGVRDVTLSQAEWQRATAVLFERIPLQDILAAVDFESSSRQPRPPRRPRRHHRPPPARHRRAAALATLRSAAFRHAEKPRHRAARPRQHDVGAPRGARPDTRAPLRPHRRGAEAIWLRPTIDQLSCPGDGTTVSDDHDNVHWLVARTPTAWTLDFIAVDLDRSRKTRCGDFVDVHAASPTADGSLRAPRLDFAGAIARYGRET
jgi:hypothetical protein